MALGEVNTVLETIDLEVAHGFATGTALTYVAGTPIDLARIVGTAKPVVRARYSHADAGEPTLGSLLDAFLKERGL